MRNYILLLAGAVILLMTSCMNDFGHVTVGSGTRYVNDVGGPQTVTLPDGSHVVLLDGAVIMVAKGFGKEGRDVDIDGRGMFFVRMSGTTGGSGATGASGSAANGPFVVHTGNLIIEVLDSAGGGGTGAGGDGVNGWGARFAVDAVRKQAGEETDLLDGKLRVSKSYHSDTDSLPEQLTAGDMVMINREIDLMEKEKMSGPEEDKVKEKFHISDR